MRSLSRARAFSLTVILVTAIGIGANTAAFSVADFVLFRPLPFPQPDTLVRICEGPRSGGGWGCNNQLSPANYRDVKERSRAFAAMGAFASTSVNLVGAGEPRRLTVAPVTPEVLPLLGVSPLMGRVFATDGADGSGTTVLSHGLWQSQFGGDPGVVGRTVILSGVPHTVIGVMPAAFYFPTRGVQLWTPLVFREADLATRGNRFIEAVARLGPDVTFEQARTELWTIVERLAQEYPDRDGDTGVSFFRMRDTMSPRFRLMLLSLGGASLCLLLLTCANLASVLLARATAQERELAVRAALGAGRQRLIRQPLMQTLVLTLSGGVVGVALAVLIVPFFSSLVPPTLPVAMQPSLDLRVLSIATTVSLLTALGVGLLPVLRAGRTGSPATSKWGRRADSGFVALRDGRYTTGGARQRVRATLVAVEVALSIVLLISAGLLIRAVWRVQAVDPGFVADQALSVRTELPRPTYDDPVRRTRYFTQVLQQVRALPGVEAAGFTSGLPMVVTGLITAVEIPGRVAPDNRGDTASHRWITAQYFKAMGIPLLRGRDVDDSDTADRQWVAVVSESFARRYWPEQDAIGQTIRHRGATRLVVGVVGDVRVRGLERSSEPQLYLPAEQTPDGMPGVFDPKDLVIRHTGDDEALVTAVRRIVRGVDPGQPIADVQRMADVLAGDTASRTAQLQVLGVLAAVAVLLAGVGLYGLLAYTVAQRSQEIGVRLALGAEPAQVGRMIVGDGLRLALLGMVPGALSAYAVGWWMSALLFGVSPSDPATFSAAVLTTLAIALAGSLVPAYRAVLVSPMSVLKAE